MAEYNGVTLEPLTDGSQDVTIKLNNLSSGAGRYWQHWRIL